MHQDLKYIVSLIFKDLKNEISSFYLAKIALAYNGNI